MNDSLRPSRVMPWEELTWPANDFWILGPGGSHTVGRMVMIASANMPFTPPESG